MGLVNKNEDHFCHSKLRFVILHEHFYCFVRVLTDNLQLTQKRKCSHRRTEQVRCQVWVVNVMMQHGTFEMLTLVELSYLNRQIWPECQFLVSHVLASINHRFHYLNL